MIAFVLGPRSHRPDRPRCAVVGCTNDGRPHRCPYDGTFHGHGRIHYDCHSKWVKNTKLSFEPDDWHLLCPDHYREVLAEINARTP